MKKIQKGSLILALGLVLTLTACGEQNKGNQNEMNNNTVENAEVNNKDNPQETAPDTNPEGVVAKEAYVDEAGYPVTLNQAVDAFKKQWPEGKLKEVSFEKEGDRYVYELDGESDSKEYSLKLDATSGEILGQKEENDQDMVGEELSLAGLKTEKEAFEAGKKAINEEVKGIESWSLEIENGKAIYQVEFDLGGQDREVTLDAKTLEVLEIDD